MYLVQAMLVGKKIEQGKDNRSWLLCAQKAIERPFTVELDDRLQHWRLPSHSLVRYDVLAYMITVRRACPQEQAEVES